MQPRPYPMQTSLYEEQQREKREEANVLLESWIEEQRKGNTIVSLCVAMVAGIALAAMVMGYHWGRAWLRVRYGW